MLASPRSDTHPAATAPTLSDDPQSYNDAHAGADALDPAFLAAISHELRTPLSGLLGMLELLALAPLTDTQRDLVRVGYDTAKTFERVTQDLLDFSKLRCGQIRLEAEATDVRRLVADVAALMRAEAPENATRIVVRVDPRVASMLMVDAHRLRQILLNLASNALKFTPEGEIEMGLALLGADSDTQHLEWTVVDSGIGMTPDMLSRIWEPFAQATASTHRRYGGTGLGLTIARQLAERMGGQLSLRSRPQCGTTARLRLTLHTQPHVPDRVGAPSIENTRSLAHPTSRQTVPHTTAIDARRSGGSTMRLRPSPHGRGEERHRGLHILVVDDDPTNRLVTEMQLARLGCISETQSCGARALEQLRRQRYDMMLTDCRMPGLDGYALCTAWRRLETAGALPMPVLGLTANPLALDTYGDGGAPMDGMLIKPVTLATLERALADYEGCRATRIQRIACRLDEPANHLAFDQLALRFGGEAALQRILTSFSDTAAADLQILLPLLERGELRDPECRMRLHRLTGSLLVLGDHPLAEEGAALESQLLACAFKPADEAAMASMASIRHAAELFCARMLHHIDAAARRRCPGHPTSF